MAKFLLLFEGDDVIQDVIQVDSLDPDIAVGATLSGRVRKIIDKHIESKSKPQEED